MSQKVGSALPTNPSSENLGCCAAAERRIPTADTHRRNVLLLGTQMLCSEYHQKAIPIDKTGKITQERIFDMRIIREQLL